MSSGFFGLLRFLIDLFRFVSGVCLLSFMCVTLLFWNLRFLHSEWKEMTNNCSIGSIGEEFGFFNSKNTKVLISNS